MIVLIGSGQSNMKANGAGTGGDRSTEPGVWCWEQYPQAGQTKGWKQAGPDDPNFPWRDGPNAPGDIPNGGVIYARARYLRQTTGETIYVIREARGGQEIAQFLPGASMWTMLLASIRDAAASPQMASRAGLPLGDEYHWFQGEADGNYSGKTGAQWLADLTTHINYLRIKQSAYANVQPLAPDSKIFIYELLEGGMCPSGPTDDRNTEIRLFETGRDPYATNVPSAGVGDTDGLHVDAVGLEEMGGVRAKDRALLLPKVSRYTETEDGLVFIDGGTVTVWPGQTVSVPLPVAVQNYTPNIEHYTIAALQPRIVKRNPTSFLVENTNTIKCVFTWNLTARKV